MDATAGTVQGKRGRKMTVTCNKCGIVKGFIEEKGNQTGLYCNKCGKWIKWLTKDKKRLFAHNYKSKMTNADRIRSMTDEELAMALLCVLRNLLKSDKVCKDCTLAWLQKESEE